MAAGRGPPSAQQRTRSYAENASVPLVCRIRTSPISRRTGSTSIGAMPDRFSMGDEVGDLIALQIIQVVHMFAEHTRLEFPTRWSESRIQPLTGFMRWVVSWARQALCGFHGHVMVLRVEPARLSLYCLECGATTPGWTFDGRPPVRRTQRTHPRVQRRPATVPPEPNRDGKTERRWPQTFAA